MPEATAYWAAAVEARSRFRASRRLRMSSSDSGLRVRVKRVGDFEQGAELIADLGQILVLAEEQGHVELFSIGHPDQVDGDAHVDPFLFRNLPTVGRSARKSDCTGAVPDRSIDDLDTLPTECSKPVFPEMEPEGVRLLRWSSRVETDLVELPASRSAHCFGEGHGVEVGPTHTEGSSSCMKDVLCIEEGDGAM